MSKVGMTSLLPGGDGNSLMTLLGLRLTRRMRAAVRAKRANWKTSLTR